MDNLNPEQTRLLVKAVRHYQAHNCSVTSDRYKELNTILDTISNSAVMSICRD